MRRYAIRASLEMPERTVKHQASQKAAGESSESYRGGVAEVKEKLMARVLGQGEDQGEDQGIWSYRNSFGMRVKVGVKLERTRMRVSLRLRVKVCTVKVAGKSRFAI